MRRLRSQVERIAPYFRKALVRGESGSGKRLVAQALHRFISAGPFVACRAVSLAEALAGDPAAPEAAALLESARGGTLYLEEVGEVPFSLQPALLRFVAEYGGAPSLRLQQPRSGLLPADNRRGLRIVGATLRDLRTLSSIGQFRPDLYAQLAVIELVAPPLRQRTEDLPLLAEWILTRVSRRTGLPAKVLSGPALAELTTRSFPANLRELEQVVTHAAALAEGPVIDVRHLAPAATETHAESAPDRPPKGRTERLQDVIHEHVVDVLTRCGGNKLRAAELLGISRSTLYRMLDAGPVGGLHP